MNSKIKCFVGDKPKMFCRHILKYKPYQLSNSGMSFVRNYALFAVTTAKDVFGEGTVSPDELNRQVRRLDSRINSMESRITQTESRLDQMEFDFAKSIMTNDKSYAKHVLHKHKKSALAHLMTDAVHKSASAVIEYVKRHNTGFTGFDTDQVAGLTTSQNEVCITKTELFEALTKNKKLTLSSLMSNDVIGKSASYVSEYVKNHNNSFVSFDGADQKEFCITNEQLFEALVKNKRAHLISYESMKGVSNFFQGSKTERIRSCVQSYNNDIHRLDLENLKLSDEEKNKTRITTSELHKLLDISTSYTW